MVNFKEEILKIVDKESLFENELLKNHISFKVGGKADYLIEPSNIEMLIEVINFLKNNKLNYFIMGNGSNLLAKDEGYRGIIVKISSKLNNVKIIDNIVEAESGVLLSTLSKLIAENSLEGFEFASGIPGTLGGGIFMNAGAYDGEIKDVIEEVTIIDENGNLQVLNKNELELSYRSSIFQKKDYVILKAKLKFKIGDESEIKSKINELTKKRVSKQPLNLPSAGSTFKRPDGYYAAKLIDDAGLRGMRYKDAMVSEKHCGFIVNVGEANADDILTLIDIVKKTVNDKFSVMLEREVRIIGE